MHLFVQACILGLLTGGVYALMASGLTLAFGIMRVINVAQGALIVLGAYLSYTLFTHFQIDPFVGVLVIAPAMFALGLGPAAGRRRRPRVGDRLRPQRGDRLGRRRGVRDRVLVQSGLALRPDLAVALDHRPGRTGQPWRRRPRGARHGGGRGGLPGGDLAHLVSADVLRPADRDPARPAPGTVRDHCPRGGMRAIGVPGASRAVGTVGVLAAFPFMVGQEWVQIGVLTLMYAALATAW